MLMMRPVRPLPSAKRMNRFELIMQHRKLDQRVQFVGRVDEFFQISQLIAQDIFPLRRGVK